MSPIRSPNTKSCTRFVVKSWFESEYRCLTIGHWTLHRTLDLGQRFKAKRYCSYSPISYRSVSNLSILWPRFDRFPNEEPNSLNCKHLQLLFTTVSAQSPLFFLLHTVHTHFADLLCVRFLFSDSNLLNLGTYISE
jgi:hypothetical protein